VELGSRFGKPEPSLEGAENGLAEKVEEGVVAEAFDDNVVCRERGRKGLERVEVHVAWLVISDSSDGVLRHVDELAERSANVMVVEGHVGEEAP
jgi:hypothetical protein